MIYLILDTNTWIYLANSMDPTTKKLQEGNHFKLFKKLVSKVGDESIKILTSELIEREWSRNKTYTSELIKKYKNKLRSDLDLLKNIQNTLQDRCNNELNRVISEYEKCINLKIAENKQHISSVQSLLNNSIKIDISENVKSFSADWSVEKRAPFRGDKSNSMADAYILFSSIDYIKNISNFDIFPISIFVSGNKGDYSSPDNANKIHDDLSDKLNEVKMSFFNSLPRALNFIDEKLFEQSEINEIELDMDEFYEYHPHYCEICNAKDQKQTFRVVDFSDSEIVEEELEENEEFDSNQLKFDFVSEVKVIPFEVPEPYKIQRGYCSWCISLHVKCKNCNTITALESSEHYFECRGCGLEYKISRFLEGVDEQKITIVNTTLDEFEN